jgi:hypothetical protein
VRAFSREAFPRDRVQSTVDRWRHIVGLGFPVRLARFGEVAARDERYRWLQTAADQMAGSHGSGGFAEAMRHADATFRTVAVIAS